MTVEAPGASPSGGEGRTVARLAKVVELALGEVELSLPQYRALAFLDAGSSAPTALAGHLAVTKPSITALVDGLVARGYVERRPDPEDRRRVVHTLTPAGQAALARADVAVEAALDRLLARLPEPDRTTARHGLRPWARALAAAREVAARGTSGGGAPLPSGPPR